MPEAPKQPHPLGDLLLTVVLPSLVLEYLSKPERLGPAWALVVALLMPLGFGVWCFMQKRGLNFFSIFGLIAVIVTGGLGLLKLDPVWFAAKEAAFPMFLGLAFPLSFRWGRPLVSVAPAREYWMWAAARACPEWSCPLWSRAGR